MGNYAFTKGISNGYLFEYSVFDTLKQFLKVPVRFIRNLKVYSIKLGKFTDIDLLVITPYRVYCVEIKGFKSELVGSINDKYWIGKSGKYETEIFSPVIQNFEHVRSLNSNFRLINCEPLEIEPVICVCNKCYVKSDYKNIYTLTGLCLKIEHDSTKYKERINMEEVIENIKRLGEF